MAQTTTRWRVEAMRELGTRQALIDQRIGEGSLAHEDAIEIQGERGPETRRGVGILRGAGEPIGAVEAFLRKSVGPVWGDLEVIAR